MQGDSRANPQEPVISSLVEEEGHLSEIRWLWNETPSSQLARDVGQESTDHLAGVTSKGSAGAFPTPECRDPLGSGTHSFLHLAIHVWNTRWQQPHEISASQELQGSRPPPGRGMQLALPEQARVITLSCERASPHRLSCRSWGGGVVEERAAANKQFSLPMLAKCAWARF